MLRGAQTPGELKQRSERLHSFVGLGEVQETLERLIEREQVARLPRRPGQKEERFEHLLGGEEEEPALAGEYSADAEEPTPMPLPGDRLNRLEAELAELREQVAALREALGE
jgi:uncharacterized protein YceH (UPF0502 family)